MKNERERERENERRKERREINRRIMTRFMMAGLFSSLLSAVKVFICSFSDIITRIVNGITCNDTTHYWVAAHVERNGVTRV